MQVSITFTKDEVATALFKYIEQEMPCDTSEVRVLSQMDDNIYGRPATAYITIEFEDNPQ